MLIAVAMASSTVWARTSRFRALYTCWLMPPLPKCIETLKNVDPTQSSFARGICFALHDARPLKLRKAALFFLALIAEKWFNTLDPIMTPDETKCLCVDWASAVDKVGHSTEQLIASVCSEQWQFTPEDGIVLEDDTLTLVSKEHQPEKNTPLNTTLILSCGFQAPPLTHTSSPPQFGTVPPLPPGIIKSGDPEANEEAEPEVVVNIEAIDNNEYHSPAFFVVVTTGCHFKELERRNRAAHTLAKRHEPLATFQLSIT
ncbi:hypothetical protein BJ322DRAFT_1022423 [Thelephora terrestris]|uniref:Uncharacterized protein n=1 Tax=Thelephora terrestris TaxID=56493 RepID=A0A9P6L4G4_9AGAM|nr:hypothetical protein BJ322DRAFT_1022423 [Thelephora terrestris]